MEAVVAYVAQIDELLSAGAAMFPGGQPASAGEPGAMARPTPAYDGDRGLAAATQQADNRYHDINVRIAELTVSIDEAVKLAAAQAIQAGIEARSIRGTAITQADVIDGATTGSDGLGRLVSAMDERLAAMQNHIDSTRERLRAASIEIRQLSVELSAASAARG